MFFSLQDLSNDTKFVGVLKKIQKVTELPTLGLGSGGADVEFAGACEFTGEISDFREFAPVNSQVRRTFSPITQKRSLSALSR